MAATATAVRNVSVITTGSGWIHPEHMYGTRKPSLWWIVASKQWLTIPINVFVIETGDGIVLFDAGLDPRVASDPNFWPDRITRAFMKRIFRFDIEPDDRLGNQLQLAGHSPTDVSTVVFSHLHFDHVGGIADVPQAELLTSREAWAHQRGRHAEREAVLSRDLSLPGAKWQPFDFEATTDPQLAPFTQAFDVMGDGSMVVLPTPGHLAGSVSLFIRRANAAPVLLIGDLTYSEELLQRDQVAGTGDKKLLLESYAKVRGLKAVHPDLVIVASHDTTAATKLGDQTSGPVGHGNA
jgi:N-acyl homoserine lactone hydrolase